jgi:diguanylate cyclase (GGDEF)-like protein
MTLDILTREELQSFIFQLEQALYNHQQWYNLTIRSLICKLPVDKHDVSNHPHKECRFGQWYYETASEKLCQHPGFIELGEEHRKMHALAAKLLETVNRGAVVSPYDYDSFSNSIERMRLELSVLQRELTELLYNRDALTGAINRVNMLPVLREQQELVKRKVQACSITMLDLDDFKNVNDKLGHAAGDCVLAGIARYIIETIRPYDKLFRVGGEEFLICFQNANQELALEMVERLRIGISLLKINIHKKEKVSITASFGISSIESDISVEQSIENADQALYMAKNDGKNCTGIWQP